MPLPSPDLDDRSFDQLVADAVALIKAKGNAWREPAVGDPGMVLLDAFAYITEQLLYRLNRIPEKAYVEFLNPDRRDALSAERGDDDADLLARRAGNDEDRDSAGTRASVARSAASASEVIFSTVHDATIDPGKSSVTVRAINAERIEDELVGTASGEGGQTFTVAHPPIVGPSGTSFDVLVAVELGDAPGVDRTNARVVDGVAYEIWREVESFADAEADAPAYALRSRRRHDLVCAAPAPQRRSGARGGPGVPLPHTRRGKAHSRRLRNRRRAGRQRRRRQPRDAQGSGRRRDPAGHRRRCRDGGRSTETLENALLRGPREFHACCSAR